MAKTAEKKTLWQASRRNFLRDRNIGHAGEVRIKNHMAHYRNVTEVRDISTSKRGIADDIDFEIVYDDGHVSTLEVKTDLMAHETGNLVYEELSNNNPGCFARTKADHIAYMLEATGETYILHPERFRSLIAEIKENKDKAAELGIRATRMGQGAYGYLIPIRSMLKTDVVECTIKVA